MRILAIDTSTMVSSVAVISEDKLLAEITVQTRLKHSETLQPHIESVLQMSGTGRRDLTGIAVTIGPGSFTGLRIGLAAAKAMAYALSLPIIGVSALEALAYHYPVPGLAVVPLIDAQKGNAYAAVYHWQPKLSETMPVRVMPVAEVLEYCASMDEQVVLLGDMAAKKLAHNEDLSANVQLAQLHTIMPRAVNTALRGRDILAEGRSPDDVMSLAPVYIRRSEAEVLWDKRHEAKADA